MVSIFAESICRCIFLIEIYYILIQIALKLFPNGPVVPQGPIDNKLALVQVI